jgi:hypothetical protein
VSQHSRLLIPLEAASSPKIVCRPRPSDSPDSFAPSKSVLGLERTLLSHATEMAASTCILLLMAAHLGPSVIA